MPSASMDDKLSRDDLHTRGVSGVLPKTSDVDDIINTIETVLDGNDYFK